jgi:hypothetical protein
MKFGRGLAHELFEIEVKGIAAYKQGFLGQGIDGMRQQKVAGILEWIFQDSLHPYVPTSGTVRTKCAWFSAGKNK